MKPQVQSRLVPGDRWSLQWILSDLDESMLNLLIRIVRRYVELVGMIRTFADKQTAAVFAGHVVQGLPSQICFRWSEGEAWDVEILDYH